jgi:hypothetical protein
VVLKCARGFFPLLRFGSHHLTPSGRNIINLSLYEKSRQAKSTVNQLDKSIQFSLRKRSYDFSKSDSVIAKYDGKYKRKMNDKNSNKPVVQNGNGQEEGKEEVSGEDDMLHKVETNANVDTVCEVEVERGTGSEDCTSEGSLQTSNEVTTSGAVTDEDVVQVRNEEKKKVMLSINKIICYECPSNTTEFLPYYFINYRLHVSAHHEPSSGQLQSLNKVQGVYKLSEDFAKPYFHKHRTEIHDVITI